MFLLIYFLILGFIFLVTYGLFYIYWPTRQFTTVTISGEKVFVFPPDFGFFIFLFLALSFLLAFLFYKLTRKDEDIALMASFGMIFVWFVFFSCQFLLDPLKAIRPDLVTDPQTYPIYGFVYPSYNLNLNLGFFTLNTFYYLDALLVIGILGVILFYKSFGDMKTRIYGYYNIVNEYIGFEYKIGFIIATICYLAVFLVLFVFSSNVMYLDFIVILIASSIVSIVIFSVIMLILINKGFSRIDKQKLNIRKNSILFGVLLAVVISAVLDLAFLAFFSFVPRGEVFYWRFRDVMSNALFTGMIYLQISLGITLVYKILNFANFAHAELVTFGAYMAFVFGAIGDTIGTWEIFAPLGFFQWIPMFITLGLISFVCTAVLAYVLDFILFKPLRKRDASPITLMIASFALGLSFRMVLQQIFTANPIPVSLYLIQIKLDSIVLRIAIIAMVLFSTWFFQILLYKTKYGKIMRAVSDNEDLAKITGIKVSRIHLLVWIIAGGFAGVAGLLFTSYPVGTPWIKPDFGFLLLLSAFAVAVLGGIGSFEGVVLASLIIGFTENMGVIVLSQLNVLKIKFDIPIIGIEKGIPVLTNFVAQLSFDAGYKVALSYVILIIVLKIRPYGLLGEKPSGDR